MWYSTSSTWANLALRFSVECLVHPSIRAPPNVLSIAPIRYYFHQSRMQMEFNGFRPPWMTGILYIQCKAAPIYKMAENKSFRVRVSFPEHTINNENDQMQKNAIIERPMQTWCRPPGPLCQPLWVHLWRSTARQRYCGSKLLEIADDPNNDLWYWALLKTLRADMRAEKLYPPGTVFWLNAADGFDPTPVPPSMTELLISQVEDVEVAFSEIYFSTSMFTDQ